jgi:hypothetical protein
MAHSIARRNNFAQASAAFGSSSEDMRVTAEKTSNVTAPTPRMLSRHYYLVRTLRWLYREIGRALRHLENREIDAALWRAAEFHIMLKELRYPPIKRSPTLSAHRILPPRTEAP